MKKLLVSSLLLAASASAQTTWTLVAGFDFYNGVAANSGFVDPITFDSLGYIGSNYSDIGDAPNLGDAYWPGVPEAGLPPGYQPRAFLHVDGTRGSDRWADAAAGHNFELNSTGTAVNSAIYRVDGSNIYSPVRSLGNINFNQGPSDQGATVGWGYDIYFSGTVASQGVVHRNFTFAVNTTGFGNFELNFASKIRNEEGPVTISWGIHSGGVTTPLGLTTVVSETVYTRKVVDLTSLNAFNNRSEALLVGTITGLGPITELSMDNIQFLASAAIPEPGTWAAIIGSIALGAAVIARRRRS